MLAVQEDPCVRRGRGHRTPRDGSPMKARIVAPGKHANGRAGQLGPAERLESPRSPFRRGLGGGRGGLGGLRLLLGSEAVSDKAQLLT